MTSPTDTTTWISKKEAAALLGISERTVSRLVQAGHLRQAHRRVPGTKTGGLVDREQVEHYARLKEQERVRQQAELRTVAPEIGPGENAVSVPERESTKPRGLAPPDPVSLLQQVLAVVRDWIQVDGTPAAGRWCWEVSHTGRDQRGTHLSLHLQVAEQEVASSDPLAAAAE